MAQLVTDPDILAKLNSDSASDAPSFMRRISDDFSKRKEMASEAIASDIKAGSSAPAMALDIAGKGAMGLAGDVAGEAAKSIWQSDPNEPIEKALRKGVGAVAGSSPVQSTMDAYSNWKRAHPDAARHIESFMDIEGGLIGGSKAAPIAEKAIKETPAIAKAAVSGAKDIAGNAVSKALPSIDQGLLPVTKLAQKYKIPMSLDEVTGSRALKSVQKTGQDLPFSGQQAFREKQISAWNEGILNSLGEKGNRITPETMKTAYKRLGAEFDKLGKGKTFNTGQPFDTGINEIRNEYGIFKKPDGSIIASSKTRDAVESFENTVDEIKRESNPDGTISGEKLNKMRAKVNKYIRDSDNYDTKILLGDLENHIIDTMTSDPAIAKDFSKTKQQYKNFIALEPLVQKGKSGNISPINLSNRVARIYGRSYTTGDAGEIGELARIGRELLPELGGSDTATRMAYGLGSTVGAASHPFATAGVLGSNRAFQEFINRNQSLIQKVIQNSEQ